ncbi:MAG: TolC family protein, partial [Planctomycetes bacterium]|nr:TolC family protein [Planctomycetota bacterium]
QDAAQQQNPRLRRLDAVVQQRRQEVLREQAAADPDITVGAFTSREADSRAVGLTVGVEVPLWNRNQGGIAGARAQLDRDQAERAQQTQALAAEVQAAWYEYDGTSRRAKSFAESLSPSAHEALELALHSYEAGETGLLDVLDARRTAQAVERERLESVKAAQLARIRLDRSIGRSSVARP